ncbi:MAG: ribbon-helix-helix protein, CopG family [Acidimicrobiaceae bacterium]|nr:ribbon-helix-helix protein, CopG family [Candidatus Poriferisodalis multihospitum]MCY3892353.1 ribbon-helix-helix protein, CopG family [Acidimicrobiaceae bacterium]MDE0136647.1 ribbon-helix-helix protein, CopG family [Acidimicrobiaceae bacterium]MDE0319009.1 ribbon-helix-helix protein, CopG family [Acidimicrobiaceae bacterium]MDE0497716.1 ribbon-helix-helix protein, CopG family [Acidimicrobiaceae bacterium]
MTMMMLSFRADEEDVEGIRQWSERLGIERSELMRDALRRQLARLAAAHEAALYEADPVTEDELSLAAVADWGPAEDWSDWLDATR